MNKKEINQILLGVALCSISNGKMIELESVKKFIKEFLSPRYLKIVDTQTMEMCIETILLPSPQEVIANQTNEVTMDEAFQRAVFVRLSELKDYIESDFTKEEDKSNLPFEGHFFIFDYLKEMLNGGEERGN